MPNLILAQQQPIRADRTWTPIADASSASHFSSARRSILINLSRNLAISSFLYGRVMDAYIDFIVPSSMHLIVPQSFPPEMSKQLDWLWNTGPSALSATARGLVQTLFIEGELLLTQRANSANGMVTLTNKSPDSITNLEQGEGINVVANLSFDNKDKKFDIIRPDASGTLAGDIFYFRVMPAGYTAGLRGLPLLTRGMDDIAAATELIYNRLSRLGRSASHYWDVTLTGGTQETIDNWMASNYSIPPEHGEVFGHNETVDWEWVTTKVESIHDEMEFLINLVIGGTGLTPQFLGHTMTRDVTTEALFSAFARLATLQDDTRKLFETIIEFALIQAGNTDHNQVKVMVKEVGNRIEQRQASALKTFVTSLIDSVEAQLLTPDIASDAARSLFLRYGLTPRDPGYIPFDIIKQSADTTSHSRIV
uniref:Portal protein n=1 Tax=viral metagenome TaxID=1070528 RepID=A0A6M3IMR7_9ZZZZ